MRRAAVGIYAAILKGAFVAAALGTVPAVGGYSNTTRGVKPSSDFTTVGIVTQVEGGVFGIRAKRASAQPVQLGWGVRRGDRVWVEDGALARVTDLSSGWITVAGPAGVLFKQSGHVVIYKGSARIHAPDGRPFFFGTGFVEGAVQGEAGVWASRDRTQVLAINGDTRAWHPHLAAAAVLITPGTFAESMPSEKFLQPRKPVAADGEKSERFLAKFDRSLDDQGGMQLVNRYLASVEAEASSEKNSDEVLGSRNANDVVEDGDEEHIEMLGAHLRGEDIEELQNEPLAIAGSRRDAYGNAIRSNEVRGPHFIVTKRTQKDFEKLEADEKLLLKTLTKSRRH